MSKNSNINNANLVFEELEPRLLLSADGLGVLTETSVATLQTLVHGESENIMIVQHQTEQSSTVIHNKVQNDNRSELVIIDSHAPNFQQLHNDVIKAQQQGHDINVVILDAHRDGIEQISEALSKYHKLDAVHIVSHSKDGQLQLGATQLNNHNLKQRSDDINQWQQVFTEGGDLLIYGCNLASTSNGTDLVNSLSGLTGADVAASDDVTGNDILGGDWDLEYQTGDIETNIAFTDDLQDSWQGTLNADALAASEQQAASEEEQDQEEQQVQAEQEAELQAESEDVLLAEEQEAETVSQVAEQQTEQQTGIVEEQRQEIVFIDESVSDYQSFIDDLKNNSNDSTVFEIVLLDSESDGIEQINETLAAFNDVNALHIISHGNDGIVKLGNTWLSANNLDDYSGSLNAWADSLDENADILIYGCNLAESENGEQFVNELAHFTGTDVAASDDLTGSAEHGGDWELEYRAGSVETGLVVSSYAQDTWNGVLATYTVINTNDSGAGSLRQAIFNANANGGADDIVFNIGTGDSGYIDPTPGAPGSGDEYWSIQLSTVLPAITEAVVLDATTQNSFAGTPVIELDGSIATGSDENGITIETSGVTIRGFAINRFLDDAIEIDNQGGGNTIVGNYLGTDITGQLAGYGNRYGMTVKSDGNIIGGTTDADRNIISGNTSNSDSYGIGFWQDADSNLVYGNYIGVGADGTTAIGNEQGITFNGTNNSNQIGGDSVGEGNIIAFSDDAGIAVLDNSADNNPFLENSIYGNTGLGIDLGGDGLTANDNNDSDTGPNDEQNYPVLSTASTTGTQVTITGSLNSTANSYYRIEFFASTSGDVSGHGEGETYLGFANVATDGSGNATINASLTTSVANGAVISATATESDATYSTFSNTSEFAANIVASTAVPKIYWTQPGIDSIQRSDIDGSNVETIVTGVAGVDYIAIDESGGKIYWTDESSNKVQRANLDGTVVEDLITSADGLGTPKGMAIDTTNGKIYWSDLSSNKIQRANLDGTGIEDLVTTGLTDPRGIALDVAGGKMYWVDSGTDKIQRANLDGTGVEDLVVGITSDNYIDIDIDVSGGKIYWANNNTDKIHRANLDGSSIEDLVTTGMDHVRGIELDLLNDKIYWGDRTNSQIQRANLDGSSIENVQTGISNPHDVVIYAAAPANSAPVITSNGGGVTANINVAENSATITTVTASDADLDTLTYSISGGTDAALFNIDTNSGVLTFISAPNFEAPADANTDNVYEVTVLANDGNGGTDTQAISVTVTNVNEAPSVTTTAAQLAYTENDGPVVIDAGVTLSDIDSANLASATVRIISGFASAEDTLTFIDQLGITGSYNAGTGILTLTGSATVADYQTALRSVSYANSSEIPDTTNRVINFQVSDGAASAGSTRTITIASVNDDPTDAGSMPSDLVFVEDTQGKLNLSAIDLSDVDAGSGNLTLTITSANGHLQTLGWPGVTLGGSQSVLILTGNLTDLNDFLNDVNSIDYEHATPNTSGDNVDLITVEITDNGNTGSGGGGTITLGTVNIDFTAVNDAPTYISTALTPTWTENGGAVSVFSGTSIDAIETGDLINALTINVTGLADGSDEILMIDGQAIVLTDLNSVTTAGNGFDVSVEAPGLVASVTITRVGGFSAAAAEVLVDGLAYDNASEAPQGAARMVTLVFIQDDGGTANGGQNTTAYNLDSVVTIVAVNDAPVNTLPGSQTTPENTELVFSSGNGNLIAISDVDAGANPIQVILSATNGSFSLASIAGLTFTTGDGTADPSMTFTGTVADINIALNGLSFQPTADFSGAASLQISSGEPIIILSTLTNATLGGLAFTPDDLIKYNAAYDSASLFFDGALFALGENIDALQVLDNGHIILSTTSAATLSGLGFKDGDLVEYDPVNDTASLYFDGQALFGSLEDIDAVHVLGNGHIVLSTALPATLGGVTFQEGDLVEYDPVTDTASLYFDGDTLFTSGVNIDAVHILNNGHIVLSTDLAATLGGLTFNGGDLVEYDPVTDTASLYLNNTMFSSLENIDAAYINTAQTDFDLVNITVNSVNNAPTATNLSAAESYTEDTALNLTDIVVTDVDSANVTVTLTLSDPGAGALNTDTSGAVTSTFVGGVWTASGAIADVNALLVGVTFTPTGNYNSNFTIATSVDDGVAAAITGTKVVTGTAVNDAPVLGVIGNQVVNELATLSFTATATDSDLPADTLTFSLDAASITAGMSIDANTGVFSWTPTEAQGGSTPSVTVTVTDNGTGNLIDTETFTITVGDSNTAPVLGAIGNQTVDELATLSFTATATDSDLPADTLTFSLDAASITAGMSIDANTGVFSWTPTEAQGGTTPSVTVTVTDNGTGNLVDSETFTITVADTNTAPVLGAIGNQSVDELATLSFTATATDSDLPVDTLTFSLDAASITAGMSIDANTGVFSWTPTEAQGGTTPSVTVTVTDNGTGNLVDSETFTIMVGDTNTAPVLGVIGNQSVDELAILSFTATATDSDLPSDTLTFSLDAASITAGMSIDANTGVFNWTPTEAQGGSTPSVTITVTDNGTGNLVDSETFTITVNEVNVAPVLVGANDLNSILEDDVTNAGTLVSDLISGHVSDSDMAALSGIAVVAVDNTNGSWEYTIDAGSNWLSLDSPSSSFARLLAADANTLVRFVPAADYNGTVSNGITFNAWDQTSGNNGEVFNISGFDSGADSFSTVSYSNNDGTTPWATDWIENDNNGGGASSGFISVNGGSLQLQVSAGDAGDNIYREIDLSGATTAMLTFDYQNVLSGEDEIRVQVSGNGGSSYTTVTTLSGTLNTGTGTANIDISSYISTDTRIRFYVFKNDAGNNLFIDNLSVTFDGSVLPVPGGASAFSSSSQSSSIAVSPVNDAPTTTPVTLTAISEDSGVRVITQAELLSNANDVDGDLLSATTLSISAGAGTLIDNGNGTWNYTPASNDTSSVSFSYMVTDGVAPIAGSASLDITPANDAPVLDAIGNQTINELSTLNITATATDSDLPADTLTFSLDAASITAGMSIDANTGVFSWTPAEAQGGSTPSVTVTVTDNGTGNLVDNETFTIAVGDTNTAPVLGAIGNQTVDELVNLTFTATATDSDLPSDTLTFSLDAASIAAGMSIDANTGVFSWTPTEAQGGTTPSVTVTVTDNGTGNLVDSEIFTITVGGTNTAPVLGVIGNQSINELATLSFTATATDSDLPVDTLTFSLDAASITAGMSIDANTGVFNWTPTESQGGTTPSVTVTVTDNGTSNLIDSETYTITVADINTAPVLGAIGNQTVDELVNLTFTATATDSDLPVDALTFSLDAASIAAGMSIDANTGVFSWTPTEAQGGTTPSVTVTVTDNGTGNLVDSETFTITVGDTNTAPVLGVIGNQSINELATLSFTATATDSDLPVDTLTFSLDAASISAGMSIDANTGVFSWTPTEAQGGTTPSVTVTVTDNGTGNLVDSETFTITVGDTNTAPVLGVIGNQSVDELAILSFTATATDSDLPSDTLTFSLDAASITAGMSIDANTGVFSWTPTEAQGGTTPSVTVTVTDNGTGNLIDTETFTITVGDTNTAPVLAAIGNQAVDELATLSFTVTATDSDLPADTLIFSLDAASITAGMSIDAITGVFSWTPTEAQGGTTPSVTITVTDNGTGNLIDSETFTITVGDTNTAPVLGAIGNQTVDELVTLSFTATATDSDLPVDTLTFSLDAASITAGMSIDANTGIFSWTPTEAQGGTTPSVTVTVTDNGTGNLVDSETFTITVNAINDAPTTSPVTLTSIAEDSGIRVITQAELLANANDVDGDPLTATGLIISTGLGTLVDNGDGTWNYTPALNDNTSVSFSYTITDGVAPIAGSASLDITLVNDAPNALNDTPAAVDEGGTAIFDLAANDIDIDNALDLNSIAIISAPANGNLIVNGDGTVTYTHDGSETISDSFSYTIADISGAISNTASVTITVNPVNDAPSAVDDALAVNEGNAVNIDLAANDVDVDNALDLNSIVIVGAPVNGTLTVNGDGTVDYVHNGSETTGDSFTYTITDISGAISNVATVNIVVNPVNDSPTTTGITNVTVLEDTTTNTTINLNDVFDDADNIDSDLTYSIEGNTSIGLFTTAAINPVAGELVLDYAANMNGSTQISVRATDLSGDFVETLFTVTVTPVNDAPEVMTNTGVTVTDATRSLLTNAELKVNDVDNSNREITYIITALPAFGELTINGVIATVGSSFTEDDIINNNVSYQASGTGTNDQFGFTVSDGAGGSVTGNTFNIVVELTAVAEEAEEPVVEEVTTEAEQPVTAESVTPVVRVAPTVEQTQNLIGGNSTPQQQQPELTLEPVVEQQAAEVTEDIEKTVESYLDSEKSDFSNVDFSTARTYADIQVKSIKALWTAIDNMKQDMSENVTDDVTKIEFRSAAVSSSSVALTAGVVAWVLRSGALMTSLLSTIPLWKGYDPLPLLAYKDNDDEEEVRIMEDKVPTSLNDLNKIKALKEKMEMMKVDKLFDTVGVRK